jgi:hypothetical protein
MSAVNSNPVGEIVATSVAEFTAQAYSLGGAPPFGSFVRVTANGLSVFGVVYAISSGSLDPGGRPVVRGREGLRDQAIYDQNPDLELVLRTEFSALIVGHDDGRLRTYPPPAPPPLHWSVYASDEAESRRLTERLDYLRLILSAPNAPADSLLAANIRRCNAVWPVEDGFLIRAGRELATMLQRDYARLQAIIRSVTDA